MRYVFGLLVLFFTSAFGCAQSSECVFATQQALDLSGFSANIAMDGQLANSTVFAKRVIESWRLPADSTAVVQAALQKGVDPATVSAELLRLVATGCDPVKMRAVVQQFSLPLVVRITALENASITPQGIKEIEDYVKSHTQDVPSLPRMAALQKLDNTLHLADFRIRSILAMQSGIAAGLGVPGAQNIKSTAFNDYDRNMVSGSSLAAMFAIYRSLSDEEVRQYTQILTSEPVKSFYAQVLRSLLTLKEERGKVIGGEIFSRLPPGSIAPAAISIGAAGKKKPSK